MAHVEADHAAVKAELSVLEPSERLHIALEHAQAALKAAEVGIARAQKALTNAAGQPRLSPGTANRGWQTSAANSHSSKRAASRFAIWGKACQAQEQAVAQDIGRRQQTLTRFEEQKVVRADKARRFADAKYDQRGP